MKGRKRFQTRRKTRKQKSRRQRGGNGKNNGVAAAAPIRISMPQLCFGTVQQNLEIKLPEALGLGYRHIDGADAYGSSDYRHKINYFIKAIPRNQLWITWKSDAISVDNIRQTIADLDCNYLDLYLVHHSCGTDADMIELQRAKDLNLIRYFGVSNCHDLGVLRERKERYDIFANQIQARPPGGEIAERPNLPPDFFEQCNALGINIMFFSTISSLQSQNWFYGNDRASKLATVNKYYIQKYLKPANVVMVSSVYPGSTTLSDNMAYVTTFLSGTPLLSEEQMKETEIFLQGITLNYM
jgi:diketogulonate reductase-like aldo/keto reductase